MPRTQGTKLTNRLVAAAWMATLLLLLQAILPGQAFARSGGIESVRRSVGQIVARGNTMVSRGTGVLVGNNWGVVTNLHVIAASKSIELVPAGGGEPVALDALKVWPDLDLAYLEPQDAGRTFARLGMVPLPISESAAEAGIEVFSIGYPLGLGYSITRGVVSGVRVFDELPESYRRGQARRPKSRWIQTDCPINPGNSGGPLVTASGELVGLNTWAARSANDIYFALHVGDVLAAMKEPGAHLPVASESNQASPAIDLRRVAASAFLQIAMPNAKAENIGYLQLQASPGSEVRVDGWLACTVPQDGATIVLSGIEIGRPFVVEVRRPGNCGSWGVLRIPEEGVLKAELEIGDALPTELAVATVPVDCVVQIEGPSTGEVKKSDAAHVFKNLPPGKYKVRALREERTVEADVVLDAASPVALQFNLLDGSVRHSASNEPLRVVVWRKSPSGVAPSAGSLFSESVLEDARTQKSGSWRGAFDLDLGRDPHVREGVARTVVRVSATLARSPAPADSSAPRSSPWLLSDLQLVDDGGVEASVCARLCAEFLNFNHLYFIKFDELLRDIAPGRYSSGFVVLDYYFYLDGQSHLRPEPSDVVPDLKEESVSPFSGRRG